jgi:competence protein ComEA
LLLNAASERDLLDLPGIGAKRAQAILELRTRLGRYRRVEELMQVKGIGPRMLARLRPLVVVDESGTPGR